MSEPGAVPSDSTAADADLARLRAEAEAAEAEVRLARARAELAAAEAAAARARSASEPHSTDAANRASSPAAATASEAAPATTGGAPTAATPAAPAEPAATETPTAPAPPAASGTPSPDAPLSEAQVAGIAAGYAGTGAALDLGVLVNGGPVPAVPVRIPLAMTNRHGLVAGATGTGKTRTLQLLAEQLSENGVPVFAADIKGDLSGLAAAGTPSEKLSARTAALGQNWSARAFPVEFFALGDDVGSGIPVRATVSGFGPLLLSRVLGLNATQESSLGLVFHYADQKGLALVDLSDLRAVLTFLTGDEGKAELKGIGGLSAATAGVILRELVAFSAAGAETFFGEPELDVSIFLRTDASGAGIVSLLEVPNVAARPELYSTFLMYLLAELYEVLPEVGDVDKPKLVFFFDEAHLLFRDASKAFREAITQTVRLIRSKGVGVFFVTQTPKDVPGDVLAQLGSRVQHALRAFTPDDATALRASVRTYPDSGYDLERVLQELGTGEAIITVMSERGAPTPVAWTRIFAPRASMSPIAADTMAATVTASALFSTYGTPIDRESAREILGARMQAATEAREADERAKKEAADAAEYAKQKAAIDKANAEAQKKAQREYDRILKSTAAPRSRTSAPASGLDGLLGRGATKSIVNGVIRGLFGNSRRR
ncbi:DNA helicase HerA-like ATPase [Microbacterium testaceum]|uniref:helicase HerA-like domain-containing protein n=1 Tax=Microbacterium testaceum TaxID=2033 RepID=UPI00277D41A0|nr:helicase HerA-like domain-containing protein [Microbacterium testaceum]MDQ1174868.1 DNA helicase HerA-like ATPase [Microbacterium testaceum]